MSLRWLCGACVCAAFVLMAPAIGIEVTSPLAFSGDMGVKLDAEQAAEVSKLREGGELRLVPPKNAPEITCIKMRGTLVVAMLNRDMPPFFMEDKDGNMVGIDVEIAQAMAQELGVKVAFNRTANTFDEVVEMVVNGQADFGISKLSLTLPRAEKVKFSNPYVPLNKAVLINRLALEKARTSPDESLESLLNKPSSRIGVEADSSYVQYAKRIFPKATIVEFKSWDQDIAPKVLKGGLLAAFRDEWQVRKTMYSSPRSYFENLSIIVKEEPDPLMIIVPWNSTQLLAWANRFLEVLKVSFTSDDLMEKYKEMTESESSSIKGAAL